MAKIMVIGAKGQLGLEVCHLLDERKIDYVGFDSQQLDITNTSLVKKRFMEVCPSVVFDCAAYTNADEAEAGVGKQLNWKINKDGTRNIALACKAIGATLVYISSDYVFDGKSTEPYLTTDEPHPLNEYGKAKLAGEKIVKSVLTNYYIIRTSWVFGKYGNNFVYTMLKLSKENKEIKVVNDQKGRPTWAYTLANFMLFAVVNKLSFGIYQLSNDDSCTWFEFSRKILSNKDIIVNSVDSNGYPQKALRPKYSVMSLEKVKKTGFPIPTWEEALSRFMTEIGEANG